MEKLNICRACRSGRMYMFLSLGLHPPANQCLESEQLNKPEITFPLNAYVCLNCGLIQIPNYIPPGFFRHYLYMPSASETMYKHFAKLAETIAGRFLSFCDGLIVDIGCNDGLFLEACKDLGARTLGVEPATNIAEIARRKGVEVINEYFLPETARFIRKQYGPAAVIVTTNTFNHVDNLHAFMEGVDILLNQKGVFIIEVPHALDLINKNEFDTIYHEHLSEFSVKSLVDFFQFFDMEIFDIEKLKVHGGSMRVYGQKKEAGGDTSPIVSELLGLEEKEKLFSKSTYEIFNERIRQNKQHLLTLLRRLKQEGKKLAGYGAPAKGNTLLNYYGIGTDFLDFLADKNPLKQGLYSPGMHIPIVAVEKILEEQPDYLLILAWNFADEIIMQQSEYRRRGGKFILPIPETKIIN